VNRFRAFGQKSISIGNSTLHKTAISFLNEPKPKNGSARKILNKSSIFSAQNMF